MNVHFAAPLPDVFNASIERDLLDAVAKGLGLGSVPRRRAGGLAAWQEKRVTRYIAEHAADGIHVAELAAIARLSPGHFSRAFRASFGLSPHAMVCRYRVREAMRLMLGTGWPLIEIAEACGFADQSHFTRSFYRHAATSPGRWRRLHTALRAA